MKTPNQSDFPDGTEFYIKEFDIPLARVPDGKFCKWVNWYGGKSSEYDVTRLSVDNNWPASSYDEWVNIVEKSCK